MVTNPSNIAVNSGIVPSPLAGSAGGPHDARQSETQANLPSFAFEHVAARLTPFDLDRNYLKEINQSGRGLTNRNSRFEINAKYALMPITQTGGLVFPYNPTISERTQVNYDVVDLTHRNESYHSYKNTNNVRINVSDATWTCDTFENAVYALSVIHFFRTYSMMDFGRGKTGRPPSPMWFRAYGNYAFYRVPVLLEGARWTFPSDVDYVGVPEFGRDEYRRGRLAGTKNASGKYTWLPMVFKVRDIKLIVQHSPRYWINWSLNDYRNGNMLRRDNTFHQTGRVA
jgi:hypothetical protein